MDITDLLLTRGEDWQFAIFFGLAPLLLIAERLVPRRPPPPHGNARRWRTNVALTVLNILALGLQPVSLLAAAVWAQQHGIGLLNAITLPLPAALAATLLGRAFISYATHWLMHRVPFCWRLHRVHHLDTELDVTSTVRFHPLEFLVTTLPAVPLVGALGLTPWALALYELLDVAVTLVSHSNVRLPATLDRVLRRVIVTPDLHRIHHSTWQPETDSNFGAVFPWWDMLLGTYRSTPRTPHATMPLGLADHRGPETDALWALIIAPFRGTQREQTS